MEGHFHPLPHVHQRLHAALQAQVPICALIDCLSSNDGNNTFSPPWISYLNFLNEDGRFKENRRPLSSKQCDQKEPYIKERIGSGFDKRHLSSFTSGNSRLWKTARDTLHGRLAAARQVGYGDVVPVNFGERIFGLILALMGAFFLSFCVTAIANMVLLCLPRWTHSSELQCVGRGGGGWGCTHV
jgi:hypothetical protein